MVDILLQSAAHSSPQAFVGVGLIALYFCLIVGVAAYRIKQGAHMHH